MCLCIYRKHLKFVTQRKGIKTIQEPKENPKRVRCNNKDTQYAVEEDT